MAKLGTWTIAALEGDGSGVVLFEVEAEAQREDGGHIKWGIAVRRGTDAHDKPTGLKVAPLVHTVAEEIHAEGESGAKVCFTLKREAHGFALAVVRPGGEVMSFSMTEGLGGELVQFSEGHWHCMLTLPR